MNTLSRWSRREFVAASSAWSACVLTGCAGTSKKVTQPVSTGTQLGVADLPKGSAPRPLPTPHFPSRLHAFVWRNWQLVSLQRMASVVGASPDAIVRLGKSMGLGTPPRISAVQEQRSFITIIKRNWHLLPYDQLLKLLNWTPAEMDYALREDDFLYVKLGNLKPQCEPLIWHEPTEAEVLRQSDIAAIVRAEFGEALPQHGEPLFSFVNQLSKTTNPMRRPAQQEDGFRYCYSYFALYGDPLLDDKLDSYPDGLLDRMAQAGVNGVWLQGVLFKLAEFPWDPSLSAGYQTRLKNLRRLAERASRHGIRIYMYLNEPRSMPLRFYKKYPDLKGAVEGDYAAMCTSRAETTDYIRDAVSSICRAVPQLGGFFTISASENLTSCWSHGQGKACPRCSSRSPGEVIAGVNSTIWEGIRKAGGRQKLIAWDWGWADAWAPDIIRLLPSGVTVMSVSEWSLPIERGGIKSQVGEYCMSAVGPGPRSQRHWSLAQQRGMSTAAKIQAGNTWELSAVPYIPAVANVAKHAANLREKGVSNIMLGWTLGGYPSPNLEVVSEVMRSDKSVADVTGHAMSEVAGRRFGNRYAPAIVQAWEAWSKAFQEFPFDIGVVYTAPLQNGPSNLLWKTPTGYAQTMVGFPYDGLDGWRGPYPAEVFIAQLEKVANGFDAAIERLRSECNLNDANLTLAQKAVLSEVTVAGAAACHWRSVANQARFVLLRKKPDKEEIVRILRSEIELAKKLWGYQTTDSRLGFEASNQYFYVPLDLVEKVLNCRKLLEEYAN